MKKIYVSHSTKLNFKEELYLPLQKIENIEFVFPHNEQREPKSSKGVIKECALLLAEVSIPSVSVGIEIGWADANRIPVIFLVKKGIHIPLSLGLVSDNIVEYDNLTEKISELEMSINKLI